MKSKFILFTAFVSLLWACSEDSPSEPKDTFDANVVCPAEGTNAYGEPNRGSFTDERDGQVYKYTTIGNQVWMAENLKFDAPFSLCYDKIEGFCDTFGRFYSLHVDGEFFGLFDQDLVDTICPAGWHMPSVDEWKMLVESMGGEGYVGRRLMSSSDFGEWYTPGTDDCGFNSKPAGGWLVDGNLSIQSYTVSVYWTSTARDAQTTFTSSFNSTGLAFDINSPKMTIRCLKD
ncbi:major paralogous domain-containing protein [Fibrobacter sp. UWH5]|uniref:FISUMP domain-containing protein n=1 Tax=Fibrobacter sp. UWH5 TaxID=1896211 RepID=UPI0009158AB9|nr:FISUMP domain-containing protein [Fibrobacter sp. UWH5]SHL95493.1 major paralogous domain-containing protein [Fibrobacter sp. UWH5]